MPAIPSHNASANGSSANGSGTIGSSAIPLPVRSHSSLPAPAPAAQTIEGVQIVPLVAHCDDRGYLVEIVRASDPQFTRFGQVALVGTVKAGTVRAYQKHEKLWAWYFTSHGSAQFVLIDDRPKSTTYGTMMTIVTGERNPSSIVVPPGIYHGWMALTDDTQVIFTASEVCNRAYPDEIRVPPHAFGDVWTVKGR